MNFKASCKYVRISPRKARYVVDLIRGKSVNHALEALRLTHRRASYIIDKTLRAAIAGANERQDVDIDSLYIKEIYVDGGPVRKYVGLFGCRHTHNHAHTRMNECIRVCMYESRYE